MTKGVFKRKYKSKNYPVSEWLAAYNTGISCKEVAKKFKVSKHVVSRELNNLNAIRINYRYCKRNDHTCFIRSIDVVEKTGCWEWLKYLDNKGYGYFSINGKRESAHRYSYKYYRGDTKGLNVCHKCDNPKCVNPDHLFLGTQSDNMRDMRIKGRSNEKLNREKIINIREMINNGVAIKEIAESYSVSDRAIRAIRSNESWNYL